MIAIASHQCIWSQVCLPIKSIFFFFFFTEVEDGDLETTNMPYLE